VILMNPLADCLISCVYEGQIGFLQGLGECQMLAVVENYVYYDCMLVSQQQLWADQLSHELRCFSQGDRPGSQ